MKVVLTEQSLLSLQETFEFLLSQSNISKQRANSILKAVLDRTEELKVYPQLGQIEELLSHLRLGHRRLIEGHIKIIYRVEGETVYITDFFDSRQDPKKMKP